MQKKRRNILSIVVLVIATLVMSVLPHHHHHEKICFDRVECEIDHAVNDEHTGHERSDTSHPENCISSVSFLPHRCSKTAILCLSLSLFLDLPFLPSTKNVFEEVVYKQSFVYGSFSVLSEIVSVRVGRAPPSVPVFSRHKKL